MRTTISLKIVLDDVLGDNHDQYKDLAKHSGLATIEVL